jgi:teichuronic acid biosynthesis glycosyltransferase TuaH
VTAPSELIVVSLETWDDVWRRNQLLVDALIRDLPDLRVLFVAPPLPALRNFRGGRPPSVAREPVAGLPAVTALRAVQWLPDRLAPYLPVRSLHTVRREARRLGLAKPVLWINDHSFARSALRTGWPVVYDITDDWLLADISPAKRRQAQLDDGRLLGGADAVVVCSPALAASRGAHREVELIPNGVDVAHFTTPQARPADLGAGPVALYVGTLHEDRLDVRLGCAIADELPDVHFVYLGPDSLRSASHDELAQRPNVKLLGARAYAVVPAYMQHADAIFIPHVVSPFTESLDPIKARECVAVGTPTISTPVAGFRDVGPPIRVSPAETFTAGLRAALHDRRREPPADLWTWTDAATAFRTVLERLSR